MIREVNIINRKKSLAIVNGAGVSGGDALSPSVGALKRKFLDSRRHLHWLKIDLNAAEIIIVQYYKRTKR